MPEYTLYIDVWLLRLFLNFVFVYLLLWATAAITRTQTSAGRLALGSLVGTLYYLLYLLASFSLIPFYGLLRFLPTVILVSLAMIFVTLYPLPQRRFWAVVGYFYGIGFVAAGVGLASAYLFGDAASPAFTLGTVASIVVLLLIAEFGWGIVHERVINRVYRVPIEISCDEKQVKLTALVDTGNQLKDPLNRQSVIVVEKSALTTILPGELMEIINSLDDGDPLLLDRLAEMNEWQTRLRLIPFSSIGKNNGLLVGFRADEVKIGAQLLPSELQPTIAIHPFQLDPHGEYMALLPPHLVEDSLQIPKGGDSHAHASTDA